LQPLPAARGLAKAPGVTAAGRAGVAVALCALAVGALALNRSLVGVFYDDGLYAVLARSLATGHGYSYLHLPGAPAAIHFPPLYPLVLTPLFALLPLNAAVLAAKVLNLLLAASAAGLVAWHAVRTDLLGAGAPLLLAGLLWGWWTVTHRQAVDPALAINYGSYGEVLRQTGLGALGGGLRDLPRPLAAIALSWLPGRLLYWLAALPALGVAVYGLATLCRRSCIGFALAGYLAILAVWPFAPDRFLWAVLPWLGLAWAVGAAALWRFVRLHLPLLVLTGVL